MASYMHNPMFGQDDSYDSGGGCGAGGAGDLGGGPPPTSIHSTSTTSEGLREFGEGIDEGGLSWGGLIGRFLFLLTQLGLTSSGRG